MLQGEGQLHPRRPRADHRGAQRPAPLLRARTGQRNQRWKPPRKMVQRARGQRVLAHAGKLSAAQHRAHIETRNVKAKRRPPLQVQKAALNIESRGRGQNHPRPRTPGQRHAVHLNLARPVIPRHKARQHARIHRLRPVQHQAEPHPRRRPHHPAPQHLQMRVPPTHQHQLQPPRARRRRAELLRFQNRSHLPRHNTPAAPVPSRAACRGALHQTGECVSCLIC